MSHNAAYDRQYYEDHKAHYAAYREAHRVKARAYDKQRSENHPGRKLQVRIAGLKKKYGITLEEYEALYESQGGLCAICQCPPKPNKALQIDHDHITGKVRGLLCKDCNLALGRFSDDVDALSRAIAYLNR